MNNGLIKKMREAKKDIDESKILLLDINETMATFKKPTDMNRTDFKKIKQDLKRAYMRLVCTSHELEIWEV